jgi:hypothetical protein
MAKPPQISIHFRADTKIKYWMNQKIPYLFQLVSEVYNFWLPTNCRENFSGVTDLTRSSQYCLQAKKSAHTG